MPPRKRTGGATPMSQHNALDELVSAIKRRTVKVALPPLYERGEEYFLATMTIETDLLSEFLAAFGDELELLARKIIGIGVRRCEYAVLLDRELRWKFSFNAAFAALDEEAGIVRYKQPQEILAEMLDRIRFSTDDSGTAFPDQVSVPSICRLADS